MRFIHVGSGTRTIVPAHIVSLEIFENTKTVFASGSTKERKGVKVVEVERLSVREPYSIKIKTTNSTEYINCKDYDTAVNTYGDILKLIDPKTNIDKVKERVRKLHVKK